MDPEGSVNGQMPQAEMGPPAFSSPLVMPPSQVSDSHGQLSYPADLESENAGQLLHADYEESLSAPPAATQPHRTAGGAKAVFQGHSSSVNLALRP